MTYKSNKMKQLLRKFMAVFWAGCRSFKMCPEEQKDNPTLDEEKINCKPLTLNSTRHRSAFLVNVFWFFRLG